MTYQSKAMLTEKLLEMGEPVPPQWNRLQILARLEELKEENKTEQDKEMEQLEADFRNAQKGKPTLISFAQRLNIPLTGNETKLTLTTKCYQKLMEIKPAKGTDILEFGKFSDMTYKDTMTTKADYTEWCITTMKEGNAHWKLIRFAQWATSQMTPKKTSTTGTKTTAASSAASTATANNTAVPMESDEEVENLKLIEKLEAQIQDLRRQEKVNSRAKTG